MRILQVCPRYPPQTGGVETHVREISERLVERGHEVTVHTADAGAEGSSRERRNGVSVRRHRALAPAGAVHLAPGIAVSVRWAKTDIVHAHNYHSLPVLIAAFGVDDERFVVTPHYHAASASPIRDQLLELYRPLGSWALRRADIVAAVSEWERDQLRANLGVDAVCVPNGLDVNRFAGANPESRDSPYLLVVGRLEPYKGVQHAIEALAELDGTDLVIAGDGPYRDTLENLARETGIADRVTFLGHVAADRLPGLYAGAEVVLALSELEAYGMVVGEALAAGTPCVVRRAGALTEWIRYDGCVGVDEVDPATVREAVLSASGNPTSATNLPSWDLVVDHLEAIYEEGWDPSNRSKQP